MPTRKARRAAPMAAPEPAAPEPAPPAEEPAPAPEPYTLPFHAAVPRLGPPDADLWHPVAPEVTAKVGPDGVFYPQTPDEVRLADALGLPVQAQE
jgi:hypothetical protein